MGRLAATTTHWTPLSILHQNGLETAMGNLDKPGKLLMSSACMRFTCGIGPKRIMPPRWHIVGVPSEKNQTWQGDIQ